MGAPLKTNGVHYKQKVHQGIKEINYSLFLMSQRIKPSLAVIDGFQGMEGNGPVGGDPVDTKVAVASTDFLAADANMGVSDLNRIGIMGDSIDNCRMQFRLHRNVENQYKWMERI
jgi:uncharacterized protein (DUF362 family)